MKRIVIVFLSLLPAIVCQAKKADLKLRLEPGKEYKQVMHSNVNVVQNINGMEMDIEMIVDGSCTYRVKEVKGSNYLIDVWYDSLSLGMQFPQAKVVFSSEKDDELDILSRVLSSMKNKAFEIIMSDKGKVLEVNNITLLFESLFGQFPDIPEDQKAQVRDQLIQAYGEKAFRGNIEIVTALFPRKKVAPGDKWIIETKLESGMEANVISEYEYLGQEEGFYRFHGESKLQTADKDAYIESNGIPIKYDLSGSMKSDIKVDKDSGWIIEASITQELQGDAYISANPNVTEDMKVPMKMKNVMRITDR